MSKQENGRVRGARKILGIAALCVAVLVLAAGVTGALLPGGTGALSDALNQARTADAAAAAHATASEKTAPSAVKKGEIAVTGANTALEDVAETLEAVDALDALALTGSMGDEVIDALRASGADAMADKLTLELYQKQFKSAYTAVLNAEKKLINALEGVRAVYAGAGLERAVDVPAVTPEPTPQTPEACRAQIEALRARAEALTGQASEALLAAREAARLASEVAAADAHPLRHKILLLIADSYIGVLFTGFVLAMLSLVVLLAGPRFAAAWKKYPALSTGAVLVAMIIIQIYALGFEFDTIGQWLTHFWSNMINVLRSNSSVGMIALGMTLVVITGGIDLAVGSTLAGVSTVMLVLLDVSPNGALTNAGVVGLPNYLIAIASGMIVGVGVGGLIGLGVTKGRIPPFIITLGVMNIVRSVAQYFTKSYKTEVPREFQVIANQQIGGQMFLTILYWLVLAVIMYIITKHTAFGRHIYAIGSNERTSRLSGINVERVKMKVYMLMGLIVSVASVMQVARMGAVDVASAGAGYEMNAIAAVVVGGTSMAGGRGTIEGTVLGVLIIGIMNNLLVHLHIDAFLANAFTGLIIIGAVLMQRKQSQ